MPVRVETVTHRIRESLVKERVMAVLASAVGVTALVLACAGLYGLLAYAVSRRRNEIGLRLALGATRAGIVWMVVRDCLIDCRHRHLVGTARLWRSAATRGRCSIQIGATDMLSLVVASRVMLAVAVCAGLLPARAASRVDPRDWPCGAS